jgi:hypothetical protein
MILPASAGQWFSELNRTQGWAEQTPAPHIEDKSFAAG